MFGFINPSELEKLGKTSYQYYLDELLKTRMNKL